MAEELEQIQEENIEPTQEQDIQGEQVEQTQQETQQQPPSKASVLYNNLLKDGYTKQNLGDEQSFIKNVSTKEGAAKIHSVLLSDGYTEANLGNVNDFTNNLVAQPPVPKQAPLYTAKGFIEQEKKKAEEQLLPVIPQKKAEVKPSAPQRPSITQYDRKEDENGFMSALGTATDYAKHLYNKILDGVGYVASGALETQAATTSALINAAQQITGDKGFDSQEFQNHINNEIVPKIKEKIKLAEATVPKESQKKFDDSFLLSSISGLAEFAPAMPLGVAGMLAAGTDMGIQAINNSEVGKKLPESIKSIFGITTGTATALLTELKLDKIFGKQTEKVASKLAVETLDGLLKKSTEPITADAYNAALQNAAKSLKEKVVSSGGKMLKGGAIGSLFGGLNESTNLLAEDITNRLTNQQVFEPTSFGKAWSRISKGTASMGVGGIILGGAHIPFSKTENYIKNKVSEAKTIDDINNLKREVTQQVQGGDVSINDANRVLDLIDHYTKINSSIPVDVPNKSQVIDKIKQRDDLHQQANDILTEAQNLDPAFQEQKIKEAQTLTNAADDIHNQIAGKPVYRIGEQEVDRDTFNNYLDSEAAKGNKDELYVENDDEMSSKLEKQGGKTTIDEELGTPVTTNKVEEVPVPTTKEKPQELINTTIFDENMIPISDENESLANKVIDNAISKSKSLENFHSKLSQLGYNFRSQTIESLNKFVQDRIDGKTNQSFEDWRNQNKETTKTKENDTQNITGIPSVIGEGETTIKAKPIEGGGTQEISGGGVLQENVPSRQGEMAEKPQEVKQGEETKNEYIKRKQSEILSELKNKYPTLITGNDINPMVAQPRYMSNTDIELAKKFLDPTILETQYNLEKSELPKTKEKIPAKEKVFSKASVNRTEAKKVYNHVYSLDDPTDARGIAKKWLSLGGKVSIDSFADEVTGLIKSRGQAKIIIPKEARESEFTDSKSSLTVSKAAHDLWDNLPDELKDSISDSDIKDALIEEMRSYNKRVDIAKDFILEYDPEEAVKRFYEKDIEENKAAYEAERKAVEDWYNEQADENFDLMQDDEFINQLIKEYEQEYPEQVKGSTEEITTGEKGRGVKEAIGGEAIQEEGAKPTKEVEVPLAENPFEKTPKTQVARDKYFKQTFGENADKAEEIYNKYKDTNDFEAMQKEMQGEVPKAEKPVAEPPVPPKEEKPIETPSEEEKWTAIRKAKLEEIKGVKEMFEKETSKPWTKIQQEALEDVAKEFPKKTLNDAIRTKVERLAAKYDAKEDYNPTAKDLAVIQEFKRQTESKINAAKEELQSDNDIERFAAIAEMTSYENDLLNASKALFTQEAGRAFGFRQSESIKDENAGLQIRRMQLMRANGMEKLSDADNKFLESQWEKEKELMKKEQEIREQSLKEAFDNEVAKLQEEYENKLKEKKISATDKKASDKLRKFAEKIRNSKTLDMLGLGTPIEGEAKGISFNTKEALAKVIEKMADGMDKVEAIAKVLKEYGVDKSKEFSDLVDKALIKIAKPDTDEVLSKIKDLASKTDEKNVTNEMVAKGLIRDYVNSFIGEVDKSKVLNEAATKLKEVLPDLDRKTLRNAFLKEGEFKQPTKKSLNEALNQAKRDLLKIEKEQSKKEATEDELQKKKLEQEKEKAQKSIRDYQRRLDNEKYEKEEPIVLKKQDAELIKINKEKNQIKSEFDKKRKELEEKNKHWLQRAADFVRSSYIASLIGNPVTLAKVAYMSIIRPTSEITRKVILGNLFKTIAPNYYEAALKGGESKSLKSIEAGLNAYFRQMGEKKMQEKFQKASNEFDQAAKKYYDAVNAKADEKTLSKLKKDMDNKRLAAMGNIVYQFIGGSSIKDALQSLVNRANEIERQFGKTETESIKDGNALDKLNYILGFIGRSHSAAKTFSGRFSYAASFMARLEGAARDGSISDPNRILEIAHESYIDWERGKYQQDNWVTKKWNDVIKSIKEKTAGKGEWSKYDKALEALLKTDVAITRVPVNIIHEAVTEYTLGAFRAPILAYREYAKAKGKAIEEGYSKTLDSKEFKARVGELISKMDAEQAAKIYRLFTKGGLGAGLYGLALTTGLVQFGVFPHKGQKKKKEEIYLKEGELNPGQIMFGNDRLGETASKLIEHTPALWTTFMGLGIAKIYADDVKEGKMSSQAAWDAAYTHMQIIESSIPQTKVVSPLEVLKGAGKSFAGKLSDYGILDNYIDSKGAFINQEKKKLEMTTSEVSRLKDYKVEPPRLGVRSQNKIEVDAKHPKVGLSKDGKPYAYMNDFEWDKFNEYRKKYINDALKEIYDAADAGDIKLNQENLTDALTRITKQATSIAKSKLIDEGFLSEKNKEDEEDENIESINTIIKDIYKEAKE